MMTVSLFVLTLWQGSVGLKGILQPNFSKRFTTFSYKTYVSTSLGMPIMSRHAFLQAYATKENVLILSRRVWILLWKNYCLAYGSPPSLCYWLDQAYFEETKQLVSCLSCLCFVVIYLYRLSFSIKWL